MCADRDTSISFADVISTKHLRQPTRRKHDRNCNLVIIIAWYARTVSSFTVNVIFQRGSTLLGEKKIIHSLDTDTQSLLTTDGEK